MTIKELWLLLRNKPVKYRFANMSMQNCPDVVDRDYFSSELQRRTSERDYHMRMADRLADNINELRPAAEYARSAIDRHLGDSDPPNGSDDPLFIACQKLSAALERT